MFGSPSSSKTTPGGITRLYLFAPNVFEGAKGLSEVMINELAGEDTVRDTLHTVK